MTEVFADTSYWIAVIDPRDSLRESAFRASRQIGQSRIVTTGAIITEVLAHFSHTTLDYRDMVVSAMIDVLKSGDYTIIHVDQELHWDGVEMFATYRDKQWSHVDCISFIIMRARGISYALSHDSHCRQAGFNTLL